MQSAEDLHVRGVEALNSGRLAAARTLLLRAINRADGAEITARVESSLAYCAAETGDHVAGLELCDRALARRGLTQQTRGSIHGQRGLLLMLVGQTARALAELDLAIGSLAGAPDYLGRAYLNRGGVYLQQEQPGLAETDFQQASVHLRTAGLVVEEAMARHNLGYCRFLRGDLVQALRDMDEARPVLAPLSRVSEATCEQDRAEVLMAAGLVTQGRAALHQAASIYGNRRLPQRRGEAELTLARSLLVSDARAALTTARSARAGFTRASRDAWTVRADAVAVTAEIELGRRGPSLVDRADGIAARLHQQGLRSNATLLRLHAARVLVRRGRLSDAATRIQRVRLTADTPLMVRLVARTARLELERARGRPHHALGQARAGLNDLHSWQSTFGSLDLQTSVVGRGSDLAVHGLELAASSGRPDTVFEWSERARMLTSRVRPVRPPADAELAGRLAELRQLHASGDGLAVTDRRRYDELRREVRERALQVVGSGEVSEPCSLSDLQGGLGKQSALVAYIAAAGRVVALVATDETATVHDLGQRETLDSLLGGLHPDLDMAGSDLPASFVAPVRRELAARLDRLAQTLVEPILDELGDRRVVLTPSGLLAGVPWGLLRGLDRRPVAVTQSATSWLGRQDPPLRVRTAGLVAGPRVARAEGEVLAAGQAWDGPAILTGADATAEAVSDLAGRVDVLHLSAHGRHSAENPLFSGVELVDGPWFGYDIDQLADIPDVVLLSACEVGRSQVRYGEELIGMTTAWLHAGARCVIASAAAVNDEVAHDVLVAVHRGLGRGLDPAAALAAALPDRAGGDGGRDENAELAPPAPFVCFC